MRRNHQYWLHLIRHPPAGFEHGLPQTLLTSELDRLAMGPSFLFVSLFKAPF